MSKRLELCRTATLRANRTEALKFARIYGADSPAGRHFAQIARTIEAELTRRGKSPTPAEPAH